MPDNMFEFFLHASIVRDSDHKDSIYPALGCGV